MKNDMPKDITYCNFTNCKRNCERNISNHDFKGKGCYSISQFDKVESFTEEHCPYFMEREDN